MRYIPKLSRRQKTALYLAGLLLMAPLWYIFQGMPPVTRAGAVREAARKNFLTDYTLVLDEDEVFYIASGEDLLTVRYNQDAFYRYLWAHENYRGSGGIWVVHSSGEKGVMLAMGELGEAVRAELDLSLLGAKSEVLWTATLRDDTRGGGIFRFSFLEEGGDTAAEDVVRWMQYNGDPQWYYTYTLRLYDDAGILIKEVSGP